MRLTPEEFKAVRKATKLAIHVFRGFDDTSDAVTVLTSALMKMETVNEGDGDG